MASWRERLRQWMKPPRTLKVTRAGRTYLVLTVGIGLGALNTGNNLLYLVLGFLLSVIVLSGVLSERVIRDVRVRRLLPDGAFAGEAFPLRYEVTRTRGQAFAVEVSEADATLKGSAWIPFVAQGAPVVVRADVMAPRRGPLKLTGVRITTLFPFGLFEKTRTAELADGLVVWPRRGFSCEPPGSADGLNQGDSGTTRHRDGAGDLLGLRELEPGEDARRVHWKKSAAAAQLLKVEREREDRPQYTLSVTEREGDALERACEETAALTHRLLEDGAEVGLLAHGRKIRLGSGPGHEKRVLTALAFLGFDEPRGGNAP
ncbi:MAG: hypothetical protein AMXMBFR34_34290 [Myxococcaceae bacterium]